MTVDSRLFSQAALTNLSFSVWMSTGLAALLHGSTLAAAMGYHLLPPRRGVGINHGACWVRNHQLMAQGSESVWVTEKLARTFHQAVLACPAAVTKPASAGKVL